MGDTRRQSPGYVGFADALAGHSGRVAGNGRQKCAGVARTVGGLAVKQEDPFFRS